MGKKVKFISRLQGWRDGQRQRSLIRYSTAELLISTAQAGEQSIEACYEGDNVWLRRS